MNRKRTAPLTSSLYGIPLFVYDLYHRDANHCCRDLVQMLKKRERNSIHMHTETREGAKHIFRSPNYEKAECGDSEDSQCQEGSVHVAKLLPYCGEITA